jgi:hypothetical protein
MTSLNPDFPNFNAERSGLGHLDRKSAIADWLRSTGKYQAVTYLDHRPVTAIKTVLHGRQCSTRKPDTVSDEMDISRKAEFRSRCRLAPQLPAKLR